ncbi:hypothetical protein [Paenimyroides baculatum]|uniref:Uncharacterized protein n=1 Tax=Paenimyroides baculatum TaxID=2608000 RepID=A0A5M6CGH4_9FLAO|nr:hypothetical protein [Paenimyroides baculatum]KAA5534318.1 hypothetical protein F0460_09425 [Paenimyroides baculatum]
MAKKKDINNDSFNEEINNESIEQVNNLELRREKFKKYFPYSTYIGYELNDEEKEFIENLNEKILKNEDIPEFKRLNLEIFNNKITITPNCGSCISLIKSRMVALKLYKTLFD